jgi:cytochrome c556
MRWLIFLTIVALHAVFLGGSLLWAHQGHEHATGVVKERMDLMESMAKAQKAIAQRLRTNRELELIRADARSIRELSEKIPSLFPPGSREHPSEAKAAIWQKWADFEAKARATQTESGKLAATDTRDINALTAQARAVSQSCGACHELYRAKK